MNHAHPRQAALTALLLFSAVAGGTSAQQLLENPGFEETTDGKPTGWKYDKPLALADGARSGKRALCLPSGSRIYQNVPLESGYFYHGSVWTRGKGQLIISYYEYKDGVAQGYAGAVRTDALDLTDEWQQLHFTYSAGTTEAHLKGIAFALHSAKEGVEILLDDASLDKVPVPDKAVNLLVNPIVKDADADGLPNAWNGERRRLKIEQGPRGLRVLRVDAALFSEDFLPDPGYEDWWQWGRWGTQASSGWPPLPRPLGGAYSVLLTSDPVPVEPYRRYDVELLLRELAVYGEFIAVRWLDRERKPTEAFEERIGYYHHDGHTSDWAHYIGRVTAPGNARFARVIVGAMQSSGAIWVAKPSFHLGLGAPTRNEPRSERGPADIRQGLPVAPIPRHTPKAVPAAPRHGEPVTASEKGVAIAFANGVSLSLPLLNGKLIGVTAVACGGRLLRNPGAPPLSPLVETTPAREYAECVYKGWEKALDGVVIHSSLRTKKGEEDLLDWVFQPSTQTVGGRRYVGVGYAYRFSSREVRARRIMDRATWELGGSPMGLKIDTSDSPLGGGATYCVLAQHRFVTVPPFDLQVVPGASLLSYLDRHHTSLYFRAATTDFVLLQDNYAYADEADAQTPMKHVLLTPGALDLDDWAQLRDDLCARNRAQVGAPPETPLKPAAMYLGWANLKGLGDLRLDKKDAEMDRSEYYRFVADTIVPKLAPLGFRRLMMVLGAMPWDRFNDINTLKPEYEAAFRYLCDTAHRHGMEMMTWYPSSFNVSKAKMWEEHPEFIIKTPKGEQAPLYYSPWSYPGYLPAGYDEWTLERLKDAKKKTGLDGLWMDSYAYAHAVDTAEHKQYTKQSLAFLPWQARIEKLGYFTYCEGHPTVIGTPASGWNAPDDWSKFRPETFYKAAPYLQDPQVPGNTTPQFLSDRKRRFYYRWLANLCCPIVDLGQLGNDWDSINRLGEANRDFNAVCDLMETRHLLGHKGVEWQSRKGRAVFVFEEMDYTVPTGLKLRDVTTGQLVRVPATRRVRLEKFHTYRTTKEP